MRIFKSKACRHSERSLAAAQTQEQVDVVVSAARTSLKPKEFGHFLKKVLEKRRELPSRYGEEAANGTEHAL